MLAGVRTFSRYQTQHWVKLGQEALAMLGEPNWVQSGNSAAETPAHGLLTLPRRSCAAVGVGVLTAGAGYRLRELAQKEEGHERYLTEAGIGR